MERRERSLAGRCRSEVHPSTITVHKRFGTWKKALKAAGLGGGAHGNPSVLASRSLKRQGCRVAVRLLRMPDQECFAHLRMRLDADLVAGRRRLPKRIAVLATAFILERHRRAQPTLNAGRAECVSQVGRRCGKRVDRRSERGELGARAQDPCLEKTGVSGRSSRVVR
jgi:hypothetical protein